jgi:hypothetical protein
MSTAETPVYDCQASAVDVPPIVGHGVPASVRLRN